MLRKRHLGLSHPLQMAPSQIWMPLTGAEGEQALGAGLRRGSDTWNGEGVMGEQEPGEGGRKGVGKLITGWGGAGQGKEWES